VRRVIDGSASLSPHDEATSKRHDPPGSRARYMHGLNGTEVAHDQDHVVALDHEGRLSNGAADLTAHLGPATGRKPRPASTRMTGAWRSDHGMGIGGARQVESAIGRVLSYDRAKPRITAAGSAIRRRGVRTCLGSCSSLSLSCSTCLRESSVFERASTRRSHAYDDPFAAGAVLVPWLRGRT
jgi:hypothetical protein